MASNLEIGLKYVQVWNIPSAFHDCTKKVLASIGEGNFHLPKAPY